MTKNKSEKSKFQKEIEDQQKRLEEIYIKIHKFEIETKEREVPKEYKQLVSC